MNFYSKKNDILLIGPGQTDVGGVATFIEFIMRSVYLNQKFTITHMDTARGPENQATAGRFSLRNLHSLFRQAFGLCMLLVRRKPKIVHLNVTAGWSFWKTTVFMFIGQAFNARTIAHIHGGAFEQFIDTSRPTMRKLIVWTLTRASAVVVLSKWWKSYIQMLAKKPLNIMVIPNAPEESYFQNVAPDRSVESQDGNTILFVGSIGRRKGVFDILNAIPLVIRDWNSARFIFLGEEEVAGEKERVLQICREHHLNQYVRFPGWVTGDRKRQYYQCADIFILPSHAENLPFSLLEAMVMGLPVISTPVGGIPEVIEDGKDGYLVQPGNENQLAERILRLLRDSHLREELGKNASLKIKENYSPEKVAEQWESLYFGLSSQGKNNPQSQVATA